MHDTLFSDIDGSIFWWYFFYCVSNTVLVIASLIAVGVPVLTAASVLHQKWGALAAVCSALLAYLGLSGVSDSFIKARNDLQIAKYHYYTIKDPTDKDRETLITAYEKDKTRAAYTPSAPSTPDKGQQQSEHPDAPPPQKSDTPAPQK